MFFYIPYELKLIQYLLSFRVEWLNPFFTLLNNLDSGEFYCLVGVLCYCFNPKQGHRLFFLLGLTVFTNHFLKHVFLQPRPLVLDNSLALIVTQAKYGLPSGAAQAATVMACFFIQYTKSNWIKVFGISYVVLICISRVYIGMHFISDVIVGCLIGYMIVKWIIPKIDSILANFYELRLWQVYTVSVIFCIIGSIIKIPSAYQMGLGIIIGICCSNQLLIKANLIEKLHSLNIKLIHFILALSKYSLLAQFYHMMPRLVFLQLFLLLNLLPVVLIFLSKAQHYRKQTRIAHAN